MAVALIIIINLIVFVISKFKATSPFPDGPYAADTQCCILPERQFCRCRTKICNAEHIATAVLTEGNIYLSSHGEETRMPQPFRQRGWRQTAGQCVRMHAVPFATTSLCGSSAGRRAVDCSGSVRQPCAAFLPLMAVSPLSLNVSWTIAL